MLSAKRNWLVSLMLSHVLVASCPHSVDSLPHEPDSIIDRMHATVRLELRFEIFRMISSSNPILSFILLALGVPADYGLLVERRAARAGVVSESFGDNF